MKKYYVARSSLVNDDFIEEGADLYEIEDSFDITEYEICKASFSDCWIKLHSQFFDAQTEATNRGVMYQGIECTVRPPGHHPGSSGYYWLDPLVTIYIKKERVD